MTILAGLMQYVHNHRTVSGNTCDHIYTMYMYMYAHTFMVRSYMEVDDAHVRITYVAND